MVERRTRDPEVPGSNPGVAKEENLSQVQSEQYHHQSLCTRVKYLKLSEVKTRNRRGTVVECRTRDPEVPGSNPGVAKKKISHRSNQCTRVKYLKLSEVKTRSCHRTIPPPIPLHQSEISEISEVKTRRCCITVVECRTRDPEVPGSNPGVAKKKISHRSNQNNTTTNPSAPELNT